MKVCDGENKADCLDKDRNNKETVCRNECAKSNSAAFAVSIYGDSEDDAADVDMCHCYSDKETWAASDNANSPFTCYSMDGDKIQVLGYGDCVVKDSKPVVTDHTMKSCAEAQ